MKIQTFSVVVGSKACNATCPFCVSKATGDDGMIDQPENVNWHNFKIACRCAKNSMASTVLLTGKGEPTLYPDLISDYLLQLEPYQFSFIEIQTNGMKLMDKEYDEYLKRWHRLQLNTICISCVHFEQERNQEVYGKNYSDLLPLVDKLHKMGYTVRLSLMMLKNYVDGFDKIEEMVDFCRTNEVEQLTIRPIAYPINDDGDISQWIKKHTLEEVELKYINGGFENNSLINPVLHLSHGAIVYDWDGQNVCLTNCLTTNKTDDNMRQIIFMPNGRISYDWKYGGAILL